MPSTTASSRATEPLILGILGGVAAGKTRVGMRLAGPGGCLIQADVMAREALELPQLVPMLTQAFGPDVLDGDGKVRREIIAKQVFSDPGLRETLEGWIHPRVRARIGLALIEAQTAGAEPIVLDVPLLLENDSEHGLASRCRYLVFVDSPAALRQERATQQRGWPADEVSRREATQIPLSHKRERADFVVANDGSDHDLNNAVDQLRAQLGLT
ncbi:MAG TPA: dephospho-CoA kinase [Planctomycetes bacterium]|nr:dephospho-CoA kinase [Planctomycetota bacterium]HIK60852.1 dephospho-CoA kinase [Planctomycetota bacterium]